MRKRVIVEKIDTFTGHRDCVYGLCKGTQPNLFYSSGGDGMVVEWNLKSPDLGTPLTQLPNSVYAMALHESNQQLWIAQNTEGVHIIDVQEKKKTNAISLKQSAFFDIKFSGTNAFVASAEGIITIIDIANFSIKKQIKASDKSIRAFALHPTLPLIAAASSDFTIKIFHSQTFELLSVLIGHQNSVFTLQFSVDGKTLLTGSRDATIRQWDIATFQEINVVKAHLFAINSLVFHPSENLFATASMDKSIKIWDGESLALLKVIDKARHAGHGTSINKLWWSNYQNQLISCSDDRTITAWKVEILP